MELPLIGNYKELFIKDIPLIDVRAPVEFSQGAFPQSNNLPLMNDEERHQVGIRYKEQGQDDAIELGHELVKDAIKQQRISDWSDFTLQNPQGALYCFRGGLRSKISQQWIYEQTGTLYPRVEGGYKAMRNFLLEEIETAASYFMPFIIGGRTGSGKTLLLDKLDHKVDLEKLYQHRGSAFGNYATPQPSQIDAENNLSIALLKHRNNQTQKIVVEDEAANIGSRQVPTSWFELMKSSPLILLETELEQRIDNIFNEYITDSLQDYLTVHDHESGFEIWAGKLLESLKRIQRRLGGQRYQQAHKLMFNAIEQHKQLDNPEKHKAWIQFILQDYYDPMYDYQLSQKTDRVIFQANEQDTLQFLSDKHHII